MSMLPLALAQAAWLRMAGRRVAEPQGARSGWTGDAQAEPLRLLLTGDALALGVGCSATERTLAPRLAYALAVRLRRRVEWQVIAHRSWTAAELLRHLTLTAIPAHDVGVLLLGTNDTISLTGRGRWRREFQRILELMEGGGGRLLVSTGVRMTGSVPSLPWPLGVLFGERARQLDQDALEVVRGRRPEVDQSQLHLPIPAAELTPHLERDGFFPSASGYAAWGRWLGERLAAEWQALPATLPGFAQGG